MFLAFGHWDHTIKQISLHPFLSSVAILHGTFGWIYPVSTFTQFSHRNRGFLSTGFFSIVVLTNRPYSPPSMSCPREPPFFNFICNIRFLEQFFEFIIMSFPPFFCVSVDAWAIDIYKILSKIVRLVFSTFLSGHV